jgi:hypothetical protein
LQDARRIVIHREQLGEPLAPVMPQQRTIGQAKGPITTRLVREFPIALEIPGVGLQRVVADEQ